MDARFTQEDGYYWLVWRDGWSPSYPSFSKSRDNLDWSEPVRLSDWCRSTICVLTDRQGRQWMSFFGDRVVHVQEFPHVDYYQENITWVPAEFPDTILPRILNVTVSPTVQLPGDVVNFDATGTDNRAIKAMVINITGPKKFKPIEAPMNRSGPDSFSYFNVFKSEGNYSVFIRARDDAGNEITSKTYSFTIVLNGGGGGEKPTGGQGPILGQVIGLGMMIGAFSIIVMAAVALRNRGRKTAR
jgi:hypothetical protein